MRRSDCMASQPGQSASADVRTSARQRGFHPPLQGTRDAASGPMARIKNTNKLINRIINALPDIPLVAPKRSSSIVSVVLGAVGVAIVGGVAAVMIFSPRTRYRAL